MKNLTICDAKKLTITKSQMRNDKLDLKKLATNDQELISRKVKLLLQVNKEETTNQ